MRRYVTMDKITSAENLVNPFTKRLSTRVFNGHRDNLGVRCVSNILWG